MIGNRRPVFAIASGILALLILLIFPDVVLGLGGIRIDKQPDSLQVVANGSASFTLLVTNAGDVPLSNVVVADARCDAAPAVQGGDDNNDGILDLAETWTYTCSIADVGTVDFDNVATVSADDPNGNPVDEAQDTTPVDIFNAGIAIQKTPDTQQVLVGSAATFSIGVENTGDVTLTAVTISDPLAPNCDTTLGTLTAGEVKTYQCMATVAGDFTNTASVSGNDPNGDPVNQAQDTASVSAAAPAIAIVKTTNGGDGLDIVKGASVTWRYEVTNAGDVPLSNISVSDSDSAVSPTYVSGDTDQDNELDLDETWIYEASGIAGVGLYENTGSVSGNFTDDNGTSKTVTASDGSSYFGTDLGLTVDKRANVSLAHVGDVIAYSYVVRNTGNKTISSITLVDDRLGSISLGTTTLAPGGVTSGIAVHTVRAADLPGPLRNTARATGTWVTSGQVTVTGVDTESVDLAGVAIEKSTNGQDADTPPGPYIQAGDPVTWSYRVTNMGSVTLTGVRVEDSQLGPVTCDEGPVPDLDLGEAFVCTTSGVATTGQYANTGTVTARDPNNREVTDSDDSHYFGIRPRLAIEKTADVDAALVGETITYRYVVTNIGNVSLNSIVLNDDKLGSISLGRSTLSPGQATSGVAEYTVVSSDLPGPLQNTAQVTGQWVMSSEVRATATAIESVAVSPVYYSYLPMISDKSCLGAGDIDFESGNFSGWDVGGQLGYAISTEAHCGDWAALLGDPGYSCTGVPVGSAWMSASFLVPNTNSPTLTFWYRTLTYDANPDLTNKFDSFDVLVAGSLGFRYANQTDVLSCSTLRDSGWRQKTIDLSAYRGQNATIEFQNHNRHDSFYNTWTYIDDIALEP